MVREISCGGPEMICHQCGGEITVGRIVYRNDECPHCSSDVHCCLNCSNYEPAASNRCREPNAEWVSDRERANFCDFFIPNKLTTSDRGRTASPKEDARKAFDSLFKK
jgi:hypothetical protein